MFPDELFDQYKLAMMKFAKAQKALFRRFGSNLGELSDDLGMVLAPQFDNSDLSEYAGQCWMAAAKCEQDLENKVAAVDYLIKAGNAFVRADERATELFPGSNTHEHLTHAVRCFNDAISLVGHDSPMSAGIIRQLKKISNGDKSSNFISSTHRVHDLDISARLHIQSGQFISALEQLTEVFDILQEEKSEDSYGHTLAQTEVMVLLLLLLLQLPPGRQSPIHMKILDKFAVENDHILEQKISPTFTDDEYVLALQNLHCACTHAKESVLLATHSLLLIAKQNEEISKETEILLRALELKFK